MSDTIAVGPWMGEFGNEIEYWQGRLRYMHRRINPDSVYIVAGYPGRDIFYEHANVYIPVPQEFMGRIEDGTHFARWDTLVETKSNKVLNVDEGIMAEINKWFREEAEKYDASECLFPKTKWPPKFTDDPQQENILFRTEQKPSVPPGSIAIFPRQRLNQPFRNLSDHSWIELIEMINADRTVVIIGASIETGLKDLKGPRIINIVGADVRTQVSYLQMCSLAVTQMCGAIRFASYVGIPAVTFAPTGYNNQVRAAEGKPIEANPFGTPVYCLDNKKTFVYSPHEMLSYIQKITTEHNL